MKQTRHSRTPPALRTLALLLACSGSPLTQAQVIADRTAPANQRPTILRDNIGRPLVNIQTPSAAGVSRNTYQQFDVGALGLVLNNARASNPWLAKGEASLILNEINSSNPSYLNGPITVGGRKAEVVIANPSGLSINGLSFVNASRVTLTTGSPVLKNGALDGFNVQKGKVDIGTRGLNTGSANYTAILARSVVVNRRIDARELAITTGAQNVSYATGNITPLTGTGSKPAIAIDSTALGGMYANKITLLSTEAGVGVRNAGNLAATGQLLITAEGKLENSGSMKASAVSLATVSGDLNNRGQLQAGKLLMLSSGMDLNLSGLGMNQGASVGAAIVGTAKNNINLAEGTEISSSGSGGSITLSAGRDLQFESYDYMTSAVLRADGDIRLDARGVSMIDFSELGSTNGDIVVRGAGRLDLGGAHLSGRNVELSAGQPFVPGGGELYAVGTVIKARESVRLSAGKGISTTGAQLDGRSIAIESGGDIWSTIYGGAYNASGDVTIRAGGTLLFDGQKSRDDQLLLQSVNAGGNISLEATRIDLFGSNLSAGNNLNLAASGEGVFIQSTKARYCPASFSSLDCNTYRSEDDLYLELPWAADSSDASRTKLTALGNLTIAAANGSISAPRLKASGKDITIASKGAQSFNNADLTATGQLFLSTLGSGAGISLTDSRLQSGTHLGLHAKQNLNLGNLQANAGASLAATSAEGRIDSAGAVLTAGDVLSLSSFGGQAHGATTLTGGAVSVFSKGELLNLNGTQLRSTSTRSADAASLSGSLSVESGGTIEIDGATRLAADGHFSLVTGNGDLGIINDESQRSGTGLLLNTNQFSAGRDLTLVTRNGDFNFGGASGSNGLGSSSFLSLSSNGNLSLIANAFDFKGTQLFSGGNLTLTATQGGISMAANAVTAQKNGFTNRYCDLVRFTAFGNIDLNAAGDIGLAGVALDAGGSLNVKSAGHVTASALATEYTSSAGEYRHVKAFARNGLWGQYGVTLSALGGNLSLVGDDIAASEGTVSLQAMGNITLDAVQERELRQSTESGSHRTWYGHKTYWTTYKTSEWLTAKPVTVSARSIQVSAGGNLETFGTQFQSGGNLTIQSGENASYRAMQNGYRYTENRDESSSFWGIDYTSNNSNYTNNTLTPQPTVLQTWNDVLSQSGGDQLLQGTRVIYGGSANFQAGVGDKARADARIILEGVTSTIQQSRTQDSNYVVWQKQLGEGSTTQTLILPSFTGPSAPKFQAPGGLTVQIPQASDFKTQIQTLAATPGMGYLKDLTQRKDVNWQPVKLAFDQWSYKQSGLTPAGAALLGVAVAWATGGMGAELLGTTGTFTSAAANAAFASLSTQASIALINNGGDIGKALKELGNSNIVKATIAAALTAGAMDKVAALPGMSTLANSQAFADKLTFNLINAGGRALTTAAITGGSVESAIKDALLGALVDTAHGEVAGQIKAIEHEYIAHKLAHALAGCAAGAAAGGKCKDGAIGAAVGEMVAQLFTKPGAYAPKAEWDAFDAKVLAYSKLIAGGIAAYAGGNAQTAITAAETAVRNNFLTFNENQLRKQMAAACKSGNAQACLDEKRWDQIDTNRDDKVRQVCAAAPASKACGDWRDFALFARNSYKGRTSDSLAIADLVGNRNRSDIEELQSIQRLIATTPYAYNLSADPNVVALANLILDLTPIVGDARAFYDAKTPFDYAIAMVSALGPAGDAAGKALKAAKAARDAGNLAEAEAQIAKAAQLIEANTGRKGSWSVAINGNLEGHAAYKLNNGHVYRTDPLGRVSTVEADLAKVVMDRNAYQQCVTGKCGEIGDQGGHLIAATLGGAGDRINLVPQAATLNKGPWKAMENEFRKALEAGKEVKVKIEVGYPQGGGVRPNSFFVEAKIGGVTKRYPFTQ